MKTLPATVVCAALMCAAAPGHAAIMCFTEVRVFDSIVSPRSSGFDYQFTVSGEGSTCAQIPALRLSEFYLPYFADAGITDIHAATGWNWRIENSDAVFNLGHGAQQLHFTANSPADYVGGFARVSGFGYTAAYDGVKGPYYDILLSDIGARQGVLGDPMIPGSPDTIDALGDAAVPEPSSIALAMLGLTALVAIRRRTPSMQETAPALIPL